MSASSPVYQRRRQASPEELGRIPWLSLLSEPERERIAPQLVIGTAMPGDYVCRMGRSVTFWFVEANGFRRRIHGVFESQASLVATVFVQTAVSQGLQIEYTHATVFNANRTLVLQGVECHIHTLSRQTHEIGQFLLGDA